MSNKKNILNKNRIFIYTDGACESKIGGAGGWAFIVVKSDTDEEFSLVGGQEVTTINRMELQAVIEALEYFKEPRIITIKSDSQYAINCCFRWLSGFKEKNWIKSDGEEVKNRELLEIIDELISFHKVTFEWVKGHSGDTFNERANELANKERCYPEIVQW